MMLRTGFSVSLAFGGSAYIAVVMPPSRVKLVQPYWRVMSHSRDLLKRRDSTQGMAFTSAVPRVISWALAWVSDSPLTAWLLVDATLSMAQADAARPDVSRLEAAKGLAACVIELAVRQGDRFGLVAISGEGLNLVPAGAGPRHRDRCLLDLHQLQAQGQWPSSTQLRPVWERMAAGSLVLALSDFFDEGCVALVEQLAAARREVSSIGILTTEERDFPFRGGHRFVDSETGAELLADGAAARDDFLARFSSARQALASRLAAAGIRHVDYVVDHALDAPLRRLFPARSGRIAPEPA